MTKRREMTFLQKIRKRITKIENKTLKRFGRSEEGGLVIFGLFIFIMMLFVGGMAVDLMRFESVRTRLQGTMDRAVLAAADLDQTLDAEEVVEDYFLKAGMADFLTSVTVDQGLTYSDVTATAQVNLPMYFMNMVGIEYLIAPATTQAVEQVPKVEISLVLDISGSMANNYRLRNLRAAAEEFINTVLDPENEGRVTISLVPYSEQVNAGELLFDQLNVDQVHWKSNCVEFPDSAFSSAALDTNYTYEQVQHFQWNYSSSNARTDTICPRYSYEEITPWSQNAAALIAQVDDFQPRAGTSIFLGMKWGTALLDPSTQGMLSTLIGSGDVDSVFSGRPVAYDDTETLKTIVLMTDGENQWSNRISSWAYDSESDIAHWDNFNFIYYLYNYVSNSSWGNFYWRKYDAVLGDSLLEDICDEAKDAGIIVWTVGFEATPHGNSTMRDCASSPGHFFEVTGDEIEDAFKAIAQQINQLKLTQ